ncbi:hypothetical protein LTS17_010399 [Exophiala oligosperma]
MAALRTHLVYHDFVMVLCRLSLQIGEPESGRGPLNARETFMRSTRRVIELIGHLEIEPYTPSVLLTVIPLSAFLSLFHLVIDNPRHVETRDNLNFLDIAAGFFRRLEYVTNQEFPFSVFPKLASIVQNYVQTLLPMEETATPLVQSLMSSLPENDPPSEVELDISGSSNMVIPKGTMGVYQAPSDSCETIYMMNEGSAMETMRFEVDGTALDPDGVHGVPDNEVMDFFGNLLDGPFWFMAMNQTGNSKVSILARGSSFLPSVDRVGRSKSVVLGTERGPLTIADMDSSGSGRDRQPFKH